MHTMRPLLLVGLLFFGFTLCARANAQPAGRMAADAIPVGYITVGTPDEEDRAAEAWLDETPGYTPIMLRLEEMANDALDEVRVVWIHVPSVSDWEPAPFSDAVRKTLAEYVRGGGRLLMTGFAAFLPHALGFEARRPTRRDQRVEDEGFGRRYGFHSFRGHPLFDRLHGGAYVWDAHQDHVEPRVGYFGDAWPASGDVIGIEKSYITLHQDRKLIVGHRPGAGRTLAIGAFVHLSRPNHAAPHLRVMLRNALDDLTGAARPNARRTFWRPVATQPVEMDVTTASLAEGHRSPLPAAPQTALELTRDEATDSFFDVVGRRVMMLGEEKGGLTEVWTHPFRILRDLEVGTITPDSVRWLRHVPARISVNPEGLTRTYTLGQERLTETIIAGPNAPGGIVQWHAMGDEAVHLVVRFQSDFRWMWPYREYTLGAVHYGYDDVLGALHLRDPSGDFYALVGADARPDARLGGAFDAIRVTTDGEFEGAPSTTNHVMQAFRYRLDAHNEHTVTFAMAGTNQGASEAEAVYRRLLRDPTAVHAAASAHYRQLLDAHAMVTTPDRTFNEGYRWALVGTDRCWATTPGIGEGLLAGYATSADGWDGGHDISGRPGYAWYFGRDAAWSAFAINGYGDFAGVKKQLQLFRRFQDIDGKVYHEMTTSGAVHYDAADATPLYVVLAAHYLRASGDTALVRDLWPSLQRAMDFLYSTDTDGDHLIENTQVGHGWVEGGPLFGAHTTLYLAGTWARALGDAAYMARVLGEMPAQAGAYTADADTVRSIIERTFYNVDTGFYDYGLLQDGTYNPEPTLLPAVLMHFGLLDSARTGPMLDAYAGNDFSSDWGVRILRRTSDHFDPTGYHYGSVWPLYTGWAALGEYAYGRSTAAFSHLMHNLLVYRHWALGFVEEVLHGITYTPAGVGPHQCWSETNVLHPIYEGLIGAKPDAPHGMLRLRPRIPLQWDTFAVSRLPVGAARLGMRMKRTVNATDYTFTLEAGSPVTIDFRPEVPLGTAVEQITARVSGTEEVLRAATAADSLGLLPPVRFTVEDEVTIRLTHNGGVGALPVVLHPALGDESTGYRVINERLDGTRYTLTVQGPAGSIGSFDVRHFDHVIDRVMGATGHAVDGRDVIRLAVPFPAGEAPFAEATVTLSLR